ncbi:MAG TPA: NAD(P)-dependent oxidoreductase [Bacteroidia bacterium]|nr:NAD(P)-dependent oxidoreductase [Bacteroidia bacterium]
MKKIKLGILREEKKPPEKRVAFTPLQCTELMRAHPGLEIYVQKYASRCYTDAEYESFGLPLVDDLSHCDILMGLKEMPVDKLIPGKKYFMFSHTMKKQPYNAKLLKGMLAKNVQLMDYECLTDKEHNRIIGFGRYAGIIGAYNGILGYGKRYNLFDIKPANQCRDRKELEAELGRVRLPNMKILVTGGGRVANGVIETLGMLKIRKVTPYEFLHCSYREPVYCQLHSKDYYRPKDGSSWSTADFYSHPEKYVSTFLAFTKECDLLMTAHYWDIKAPVLFTKDQMKLPDFHISVIADITCDINGSVPSTLKASTIAEPFYGYNQLTEQLDIPFNKNTITIMAVDNLPCELPREASEDFGKELIDRVMPSVFGEDTEGIIERATICKDGKLTPHFAYLSDYAGVTEVAK